MHREKGIMLSNLRIACQIAIQWFDDNMMQANPEKFQFMVLTPFQNEVKELSVFLDLGSVQLTNICFAIRRQQIQLKGRDLLFISLILLDFRLFNQGNYGFHGPKSDLDLLNNPKRCHFIRKQINILNSGKSWLSWPKK